MKDSETLIWAYIEQNWVLSFTAFDKQNIWSANAFYVLDKDENAIILLTSKETIHGKMLLQNPIVSGTISNQENDVTQLKGLQFVGEMFIVDEKKANKYFQSYCEKFPIARDKKETIWLLRFTTIKYTDNSLGFGTKLYWEK